MNFFEELEKMARPVETVEPRRLFNSRTDTIRQVNERRTMLKLFSVSRRNHH